MTSEVQHLWPTFPKELFGRDCNPGTCHLSSSSLRDGNAASRQGSMVRYATGARIHSYASVLQLQVIHVRSPCQALSPNMADISNRARKALDLQLCFSPAADLPQACG